MSDNRTTELKSLSKLKMAGKLRYWRGTIEIPEDELHAICDEIQAEHEQAIAATMGGQRSTVEIAELLDEFEHECYMLRVEASETRAKDNVVRESYERIRDEFAGRIAVAGENDPYDTVSCEHVISSDTLHLILDEWDVHPGWTATNENMAQLFGHTAATLGGGKLTAEQVKWIHEIIEKHWHDLPAEYDMPEATALPEYSYDWQTIADELNAELVSGTCELEQLSALDVTLNMLDSIEWGACSECGCAVPMDAKFCNECGKAVKR